MPWQLSGNGRSDWSTKLIRGLKAEAAAGFQSRRERCSEPTPATPQYAAFSTYEAARVAVMDHKDGKAASGTRPAALPSSPIRCRRSPTRRDGLSNRRNPVRLGKHTAGRY